MARFIRIVEVAHAISCEEDEAVAEHSILRVQGHIGGAKEDQDDTCHTKAQACPHSSSESLTEEENGENRCEDRIE